MKKILLIGGEGYIGNVVAHKLLDDGYSIISYDNLIYNNHICVTNKLHLKNYKFIFLFFFIPLAISRLTPELLSFTIFLLSICINEGKDFRYKNLISALLFALSFNLRYQNIIFYIFYYLWIIFIKKRSVKKQLIHLILFILFNILFYLLDVFENYKIIDLRIVGFEYYFPNLFVYLRQNFYAEIEQYGTMPYYYYFILITKHFYFPFGLPLFLLAYLIHL